jgi:hypothetical protein
VNRGSLISLTVHALLILSLMVGVPKWLEPDRLELPPVMVVEILDVAEMTNVKQVQPEVKKQKKKPPVEEPKPVPKKEVAPEPEPVEEMPEPTPAPKPPEKKPAEKPKPKPTPKAKAKPKPKPKAQKPKQKKKDTVERRSFDEILKDLAKEAQTADTEQPPAKAPSYDASKPLSLSHIDYVVNKMASCWRVPAGIQNARNLTVSLKITMLPNGAVKTVEPENRMRMAADSQYRIAVESAIRAVRMCSPFDKLPADRYPSWREATFEFDPSQMLY